MRTFRNKDTGAELTTEVMAHSDNYWYVPDLGDLPREKWVEVSQNRIAEGVGHVYLVPEIQDPAQPTLAEIQKGVLIGKARIQEKQVSTVAIPEGRFLKLLAAEKAVDAVKRVIGSFPYAQLNREDDVSVEYNRILIRIANSVGMWTNTY